MSYIGKKLRQRRLFYKNSNIGLLVPIDHGLTAGPIKGIKTLAQMKPWINSQDISGVILHKGMLEKFVEHNLLDSEAAIILHLNGMSTMDYDGGDDKHMVSSVDTALRLGADAVSVQINFTEKNHTHNLTLLGRVTDAASAVGLPVLTMLYDKVPETSTGHSLHRLHNYIRLVTEIGSDMVKVGFPSLMAHIPELVNEHKENITMFFAGGETHKTNDFHAEVTAAMAAGANGLCVGRHVFQHDDPRLMLKRLHDQLSTTPNPGNAA